MATREQKIQAISDFLESNGAQPRGHSLHDGIGCPAHREAFEELAVEFLELEADNYGFAD